MTQLIDIVNFNPDASCLDSSRWLNSLSGGVQSLFYKWLTLYVSYQKPLVLGMTGALVSDLVKHNSDSINLIKQHTNIFQVILRPYTHDISLLRTSYGFEQNFLIGKSVIQSVFDQAFSYYLPPEFMLRSEHFKFLSDENISATFINPDRYSSDISCRLPEKPYQAKGVMGLRVGCIPLHGWLTKLYLNAIQLWDIDSWNQSIEYNFPKQQIARLWRDGESSFLLPDSLEREEYWLKNCISERKHLPKEQVYEEVENIQIYSSYPPHSFSAWMREFRMLSFITRIREIEQSLNELPRIIHFLWLMVINSDILSAVEKHSPTIKLRSSPKNTKIYDYTIFRSERGYEGEDYLFILEQCIQDQKYLQNLYQGSASHFVKASYRIKHLEELFTP